MRRLIAILLTLSLSWVTTGYACDMPQMQHAVQHKCCCEPDDAERCRDAGRCDMAAAGAGCCQVVAVLAADVSDTATLVASLAFDVQPLGPVPAPAAVVYSVAPHHNTLGAAWSQAPPAGWGTNTYLETARLRI